MPTENLKIRRYHNDIHMVFLMWLIVPGSWRKRRKLEGSGKAPTMLLLHALYKKMLPHTRTVNASASLTHTQCCSQVWTGCCAKGAELLDSNATTNADHDLCVQEAREQLYQETASPVVASVAHSVEKGANCSLSSKQRVRCVVE